MWDFVHLFCTSYLIISVSQSLHIIQLTFDGDEVKVNKSQIFDKDKVFNKPNFPNPVIATTTEEITDKPNAEGKAIENLQEKLQSRRGLWNMEEDNIDIIERSNDPLLDQLPEPDHANDKDDNLKLKIKSLVEQTQYDTNRKVKGLDSVKDHYTAYPAYRVGFLLSMLQKTKQTLNELFNVAMRHRDDWKALEQLKVFEMIIHTNVDATQLTRQIVDYHISYLNSTSSEPKLFLLK